MKIKTLVAVLLLSGGVTSAFAQTEDCNKNSSISQITGENRHLKKR